MFLSINFAEDLEDKNLSWLFNFKLDELPHLSPEVSHRSQAGAAPNSSVRTSSSSSSNSSSREASQKSQDRRNSVQDSSSTVADSMPEKVQKKPPFTYTELIEYALEDQAESGLTVSGIYQWIS